MSRVPKNEENKGEQIREQIAQLLRKNALNLAIHSSPYRSEEVVDKILNLIKEDGWIDPSKVIMPGEFGTPKAEEALAQWAKANGYLRVEPVQLEVLSDREYKKIIGYIPVEGHDVRKVSQATNAHNEAKFGQLYRRMSYRLIMSLEYGDSQTSPLRFATDEEALSFGRNFLEPPQSVLSWKVEETNEPPNYSYRNNKLMKL